MTPTPINGASLHGERSKQELLETISASRLGTWLSCRLKFYFRYLSGLPKQPSSAMRIGTVVHAVLQQWNLARWRKAPLLADMVQTVFDQAWAKAEEEEPLEWGDEETSAKAEALSLIETYLRDTPIPMDERPEGVEVSVELDLSSRGLPKLIGVMDLVRKGGCIVDFKTISRTPDSEKVLHTTEVQTTSYAMLCREATDQQESGIELHHLVKLKSPKLVVTRSGPATQQQIDKLLRMISSYVHGVETEDYVPAPGLQCGSCEFFNACRKWR